MAQYAYKALDRSGQSRRGSITAVNEKEAFQELNARGLSPTDIAKARDDAVNFRLKRDKISSRDLAKYLRQLASLLKAGAPVADTLATVGGSNANPLLSERTKLILSDIRAGARLSAAMEERLPELPTYASRLRQLGETTGALAKTVSDAADRLEYDIRTQSELRSALIYPAFLASAGAVIVMIMFIFVVPRFDPLIDRETAPAVSRFVIGLGMGFRNNIGLVAGLAGAIVIAIIAALRNAKLRLLARAGLENAPIVGPFLFQVDVAGWCRTVGTALHNKAPLVDALRLGENACRSERSRRVFSVLIADVRAGRALDEALAEAETRIDPILLDLIKTGRNSGALGEMLIYAAEIYEDEARERSKAITALAEPAAILAIAAVVGFIVISIVLAMTSLYDINI